MELIAIPTEIIQANRIVTQRSVFGESEYWPESIHEHVESLQVDQK